MPTIFDTYGAVDVRSIEIDHLRQRGDVMQCAIIANSLHAWGVST